MLGAGKAAAAMASTIARQLSTPFSGLVVVPYGHEIDMEAGGIEIITAAHPIPDEHSVIAAKRMLALAADCTPDDRLIFLASGGGSATLALPMAGLALAQKRDIVAHLVHAGIPIGEINAVRKSLSAVKGGRLRAACTAGELISFIVSDVVGDDPAMIASGPTLPDIGDIARVRDILTRTQAPHLPTILPLLERAQTATTPQNLRTEQHYIIATATDCLMAAAHMATQSGWQVHNLGGALGGESRTMGAAHAALAQGLKLRGGRHLILSGGETLVTLSGKGGSGGPNQEYIAGLAAALNGADGIYALACDTDGLDGKGQAAGAFCSPTSLRRAAKAGLSVEQALADHDTGSFFATLADRVQTGPTHTNVNDFRAIAVLG